MTEPESKYLIVYMTAPNADEAAAIAKTVVGEQLAACCNIIPGVRSIYTWKGEVCDDAEVLCLLKTTSTLFDELKERLVGLHPYDVPEVVGVPIEAGHADYLDWIDEVTR